MNFDAANHVIAAAKKLAEVAETVISNEAEIALEAALIANQYMNDGDCIETIGYDGPDEDTIHLVVIAFASGLTLTIPVA